MVLNWTETFNWSVTLLYSPFWNIMNLRFNYSYEMTIHLQNHLWIFRWNDYGGDCFLLFAKKSCREKTSKAKPLFVKMMAFFLLLLKFLKNKIFWWTPVSSSFSGYFLDKYWKAWQQDTICIKDCEELIMATISYKQP